MLKARNRSRKEVTQGIEVHIIEVKHIIEIKVSVLNIRLEYSIFLKR